MSKIHHLKIESKFFNEVKIGKKKFELRKNDRGFKVGDKIILFEINQVGAYTGEQLCCDITYILTDYYTGIESGYCILSIR